MALLDITKEIKTKRAVSINRPLDVTSVVSGWRPCCQPPRNKTLVHKTSRFIRPLRVWPDLFLYYTQAEQLEVVVSDSPCYLFF